MFDLLTKLVKYGFYQHICVCDANFTICTSKFPWPKLKLPISAKAAASNRPNGWVSAHRASNGTLLLKKL